MKYCLICAEVIIVNLQIYSSRSPLFYTVLYSYSILKRGTLFNYVLVKLLILSTVMSLHAFKHSNVCFVVGYKLFRYCGL